jgi:hypothetical protein
VLYLSLTGSDNVRIESIGDQSERVLQALRIVYDKLSDEDPDRGQPRDALGLEGQLLTSEGALAEDTLQNRLYH